MQRFKLTASARQTVFSCLVRCLLLLIQTHSAHAGLAVGDNIPVATQDSFENAPAAAVNTDSGEFLTVWTRNEPDPATPDVDRHKIIALRVGSDGKRLGQEFVVSRTLPSDPGGGDNSAVVFNSQDKVFMVVYQRTDAGSANQGIFAQKVDTEGSVLEDEISVATTSIAGFALSHPSIAYNVDDNEYLIVWENSTGVLIGQRLSSAGIPNGLTFIVSQQSFGEHNPALVYNPTAKEFFVAYDAVDLLNNSYILAQRISRQGTLPDLPIQVSTSSAKQSRPIVAYDSTLNRYAVIWQDDRNAATTGHNAFGRIVNNDGTLQGDADVRLTLHALSPIAGYSPSEKLFLLAWIVQNADSQNNGFLLGQLLKPNLEPQTRAFPISEKGKVTTFPALAMNPTRARSKSLTVWPQTAGASGSNIFGQVLDLSFKFTDLTLTVTAPSTLHANQTLTYKLLVKNIGPLAAESVTLTDTLPAGTAYKSDNAGCAHENTLVICKLGKIEAGKSVSITLKATPVSVLGIVENKAELDWANRITSLSATTEFTQTTLTFPGKLTLLTPNGGEFLSTGTTYPITWQVTDSSPDLKLNYKLSLSLNNGQSWSVIAKNLSGGSYDWTPTASKNSKQCRIKVQGYTDANVADGSDRSDAPFTLEVLRLTSPNGGETLANDQAQTVTWITHATRAEVNITRLRYSINGGQSWKLIERLTGNPGTYTWTPPVLAKNTSQALLEVTLLNKQGKSLGNDRSDRTFAIEALTLISPNGSETLKANTPHTITWSTHNMPSPVASFKLFFSNNGGKNWKLITTEPGNPNRYDWTVPPQSKPAAKCRIKVTLLNAKGKVVGTDQSDGDFTVDP